MTSHPVFPALAAPHRRASVSKQCAVAGCNAPRYKQNYCIVHVAQLGLDAGSPRSTSPGVISPRDSAPSSGNLAGSPASAMAAVAVAATIAPQSNQQQPARQMTASPAPGQRGGVSTLVNAFNDVALQQQQATRLTRVPSSGMVSPRFKMSDAQPVSPRVCVALFCGLLYVYWLSSVCLDDADVDHDLCARVPVPPLYFPVSNSSGPGSRPIQCCIPA